MKKNIFILILFGLLIGGLALGQPIYKVDEEEILEKTRIENRETEGINGEKQMSPAEIAPEFKFIFPGPEMKLEKEIAIKGKVKNALSVEFYLKIPQAPLPIYLGMATPLDEDLWQYSWDTNLTPNGNYEIFVKINNQFGEYEGPKIKVEIKNEIPQAEEIKEKIGQEIETAKEDIKDQEKEIKEKKEEIKEKIGQEIENEEIKKEVKEKTEEFAKKSEDVIQLENKVGEIEKEKQGREEEIKKIKKELEKIQALPEAQKEKLKAIEEEKKQKLEREKEERQKAEEKIASLKKELEESKKEGEKLRGEIEKASPVKEKVSSFLKELEEKIKEKEKIKNEKLQVLLRDPDKDGLSDEEEIRLGTDPLNPDSDADGFLDGTELKTGNNPLKAGPADKIIYQNPQKVPPKKSDVYRAERIEKVVLPNGETGLKITGKGLPNSFITLYIFSLPIVVVVKADQNGHWEYTLDKPLADGEHRVYAALTNNQGEIEARSEVFVFVKSGEKIFRIFETSTEPISPVQALQKPFIILIVAIIILALGIALIIITVVSKRRIEKDKGSANA